MKVVCVFIISMLIATFAFASELNPKLRADKATYFSLQRLTLLPMSVEFEEAADFEIEVDSATDRLIFAEQLDAQFITIYKAKRLRKGAVQNIASSLHLVSELVKTVRLNYQFKD